MDLLDDPAERNAGRKQARPALRCVRVLSGLALRRLLPAGAKLPSGEHWRSCAGHVARALRQASDRAWLAVRVVLADEAWWERAQLAWHRSLETEFYQPLRTLCRTTSVELDDAQDQERARRDLAEAVQSGLLTGGTLDVDELLAEATAVPASAEAEWEALEQVAGMLEADGLSLRPLLLLRRGPREPLLVALVAALFRQAVEADADLFGDLPRLLTSTPQPAEDLRAVALALDRHRDRLAALFGEVVAAPTPQAADPRGAVGHLQNGQTHAGRGEYDRALLEFTAALALDPQMIDALVRRGDVHRLRGDYALALADYDAALHIAPGNVPVLLGRGHVHLLLGRALDAEADFTAALAAQPGSAAALLFRGQARAAAADHSGAIADFTAALRTDPNSAWAFHYRGDSHAAEGDRTAAIADYSQALRLHPASALTYLHRAEAHRLAGDFDRAVADYTEVLRLDPFNVRAYQHRSQVHQDRGRLDEALADLRQALELDPAHVELLLRRARLLRARFDYGGALADLNAAVRQDPDRAECYYQRGDLFAETGDTERALGDLNQALTLDANFAPAHHRRGLVHAAEGSIDSALADFDAALRLDPAHALARQHRANVLLESGHLDEAGQDCDVLLQQDPSCVPARLLRGRVRMRRGEDTEALADFEEARRLEPHNPRAHELTGLLEVRLGKPQQALASLTRSLRLDPDCARAYANRAVIYQSLKRHEEALDDLAHATRLSPRYASAYCLSRGQAHAAGGNHVHALADFAVVLQLEADNVAAREAYERALEAFRSQPQPTEPGVRAAPDSPRAEPTVAAPSRSPKRGATPKVEESPSFLATEAEPDSILDEKPPLEEESVIELSDFALAPEAVEAPEEAAAPETALPPEAVGDDEEIVIFVNDTPLTEAPAPSKPPADKPPPPARKTAPPAGPRPRKDPAKETSTDLPPADYPPAPPEPEPAPPRPAAAPKPAAPAKPARKTSPAKPTQVRKPPAPAPVEKESNTATATAEGSRRAAAQLIGTATRAHAHSKMVASARADTWTRHKRQMRWGVVAGVAVALIAGGLYLFRGSGSMPLLGSPPPTDGMPVQASQLWGEYAEDITSADEKYNGKFLLVSGTIKTVDMGEKLIVLEPSPGGGEISCHLSYLGGVRSLKPGQEATIRGECQGKYEAQGNIFLFDASVVQGK